ncbi:MAG: DUF1566 domain-containing protein, partial [Gammaproteobacteria bacterium]|nr:DUF1566 domain-containing protein [Gammaproteobacteria bacterium]
GNALTATLVTAPASATAFNLEPDGSFTYTHDGSGAGTVSFEYEVNDGTSTSNLATVTLTINEFSFTIGEVGPGGGPVFYLDPTTIDPATGRGTAGLEAAPADLENPNNPGASDFSLPWGCSGTTAGATAEAIGVGAVNTQTIVDAACSNAGNEAAEAAAAFQGGGFSDWFLPSIDELNEMYLNIGQGGDGLNEGGFGNNLYWSSSEIDNNLAWELNFVNGVLFGNDKNNSIRARAVRVFGNPSMAGSFALEEMGPGGGLVFYLEPSEVVLGSVPLRSTAGLEASPADLENPTNPGVFVMGWGCLGTATGATDEGIGTGAANTQIIVDDACSSVGNEAAEAANAYSNNGFNDWFLPSKDELNEMWFNIGQGGDGANEGNFINDIWWSSSEVDDSLAWRQFFASGGQDGGPKGGGRRVRAVRAFGLPPPPTFAVGDVGPGGGLVFFIEPGSDGTAGLEAAPTDLVNPLNMGGGMPWGCFNTVTAATNEGIGFGASNTAIIVADACSTTGEEAAEVAIAYVSPNLLEDWFLPSIDELNEMHSKIGQGCNVPADCSVSNPGGFTNNFYWSSTEITSQIAWVYNFNDGIMTQLSKNNNAIPVRAIRAFGTTRSLNVVAVTEIAGGGANEMDDNFLTVTQVSGALQ